MLQEAQTIDAEQRVYFGLLAEIGHTKHFGGMPHGILTHEEWRAIVEASNLDQVIAEATPITARQESRNQAGRVGFGDYMRSVGGFFKAITRAEYRQVFRSVMSSTPRDFYKYIGYGIYGGRKLGTEEQKTKI